MNYRCLEHKCFLLFVLIGIQSTFVFSQSPKIYSFTSFPEKIYLQTDSKIYTSDKTIWFKAIVTSAIDHSPSELSGVLYVEFIDPNENIVERKLIKLEQGIGEGFFALSPGIQEGLYLLRGYTQWNKNFGDSFICQEYLRVFAPSKKNSINPFGPITLVENEDNTRLLSVSFFPGIIDSLHKKEINLYMGIDKTQDTLIVKKNRDDQYLLDYTLPNDCQFVSLQIKTDKQISKIKRIALDKEYLNLQFFPESGELVQGIQSNVGFKALDYNGKGKYVEGEIVDEDGVIITSFKSNQLGMGRFILNTPDRQMKYYARLKQEKVPGLIKLYPLPEFSSTGNVLSMKKRGDLIYLTVSSNYLKNESIGIQGACRGMLYYNLKTELKEGTLSLAIPANKLPEGIFAFTLFDNANKPLAERLYFNERQEERLKISTVLEKDTFQQREKTELNIDVTNSEGLPVKTNISVLVINKAQMGSFQNLRSNILSHFLLSSELKGKIENPGFYFGNDSSRHDELDALMLTQGWRKYIFSKTYEKNNFPFDPEPSLTISGTVGGAIFKKKKKQVELTMLTFGKNNILLKQSSDSSGRFSFNLNDEYGQNLNIVIQSNNKAGKQKDYTIELDKKQSPKVNFNHEFMTDSVDNVVKVLIEKNIERKKIKDAFPISSGDILLDEVVVEAYHLTTERKMVVEKYGMPDVVVEGEEIEEKEEKWSYGLYSVLLFNYPDKVRIFRGRDQNLYARVQSGQMTLVVIDGIPVKPYEYPLIPNIPPSEVKSFEIIENARNFSNLYCEVFPRGCPYAPPWGDIIAIYTHAGQGIFGVNRAEGIMKAAVPVFSASREYHTTNYDNLKSEDWFMPDLRALVYWEPNINTNEQGEVSTSFYNADNTGKMQVVIEAISEKGEIGYKEIFFDVEKRTFNKNSVQE